MPSPPPSHPSRSHAGDRVWQTACDLFYREGIRGVGVAEIVARSGVGKPSLYRNFDSKKVWRRLHPAQADAERTFWTRPGPLTPAMQQPSCVMWLPRSRS